MKARRVDKRQDLWEIEVEPASDEEVQIFALAARLRRDGRDMHR